MATPELRVLTNGLTKKRARGDAKRRPAARRLLEVERSEEIFPVLLEEIVALGYRRAFVSMVDFESGEINSVAAVNCPKGYLEKFRVSLFGENPFSTFLNDQTPGLLPDASPAGKPIYCYPLVFRNPNPCWEFEMEHRGHCLAADNYRKARPLRMEDQICTGCEMRSYAGLVMVEVEPGSTEADLDDLRSLIDLSNSYLARLFKVEHYYNRMRDMELRISSMETVMHSMTDPVILTDTHHQVIVQNHAAERYFKLPEEVSEGRVRAVQLNNLLFSAALSSMAVSGSDASRDLTLVDAIEGEERLFEAVTAPTFARDGRATGMVTVMRDVTDLRRADQELRANYEKLSAAEEVVRQDRDRLNLIIENVGDPIVVCDSAAKIVMLDPLAQELFGGGAGRKSDRQQIANIAQLDAYVTAFTFSFSDKESGTLHLYNPESKAEVEYDARSGKIYDDRGQVAYTVTVLRDLSALRKLEQMKVERRMLEIEKFAATGRLAATIAHEVNNPMEAIKNAIYLLQNNIKPEARSVYDVLKAETDRVARIVRQMLGLYRSSEQVRPVNLNAVVEDTLLLLARQLQRGNVEVKTDLRELPEAVLSADQIQQVLSNLIINARDAMPNGGTLHVRTRHIDVPESPRGWVRVMLADTGSGIPQQMLRSIFEPFVTTKGEKGTGLGLWIVNGIVANHGGKIAVRSRVGRGTVFNLDFPVVR